MLVHAATPCVEKKDWCPKYFFNTRTGEWTIVDDFSTVVVVGAVEFREITDWVVAKGLTTVAEFIDLVEIDLPAGITQIVGAEPEKSVDFAGARMSRIQFAAFCLDVIDGKFSEEAVAAKVLAAVG